MYDVIIVGGSYAGMAAAMPLLRARRKVAIVDAGIKRNRFAATSHGLLGQDGYTPDEIVSNAKQQLLKYSTLTWVNDTALHVEKQEQIFSVRTEQHKELLGKRLILATGVKDNLPSVPGLAERWGKSVFHCPYCHGYELNMGKIGVLASSEISMHQGLLLPDWGATTLFTNGTFIPDEEQLKQLRARKVNVETEQVSAVTGDHATVELRDGRAFELAGLFVVSQLEIASPLVTQLGCDLSDSPLGSVIKTGELKDTSVAGVYACGDVARAAGNVALAISDGTFAGLGAHSSLILDELAGC